MPDPEVLETKWQANERRLTEIGSMSGLGREMHATETERLEAEQDRIEWHLGFERPADAESRKWSGMV
jgi:hypothetical protein